MMARSTRPTMFFAIVVGACATSAVSSTELAERLASIPLGQQESLSPGPLDPELIDAYLSGVTFAWKDSDCSGVAVLRLGDRLAVRLDSDSSEPRPGRSCMAMHRGHAYLGEFFVREVYRGHALGALIYEMQGQAVRPGDRACTKL